MFPTSFYGRHYGEADADGDGTPDVAVGVSHDDDGGAAAGRVDVILLNSDGTVKAVEKTVYDQAAASDQFGRAVTGLGDVDGDGVADYVVTGADRDGDGVPDWADKKPGKDDKEELKEALKKILRKHL